MSLRVFYPYIFCLFLMSSGAAHASKVNINFHPTVSEELKAEIIGETTKTFVIDSDPTSTVAERIDSIFNLPTTRVYDRTVNVPTIELEIYRPKVIVNKRSNKSSFSVGIKSTISCISLNNKKLVSTKTFNMEIKTTKANALSITPNDLRLIWRNGSVALANRFLNDKNTNSKLKDCGISFITQTEASNLHHLVQKTVQ